MYYQYSPQTYTFENQATKPRFRLEYPPQWEYSPYELRNNTILTFRKCLN